MAGSIWQRRIAVDASGDATVSGTTPRLTIGDAGEEDTNRWCDLRFRRDAKVCPWRDTFRHPSIAREKASPREGRNSHESTIPPSQCTMNTVMSDVQ